MFIEWQITNPKEWQAEAIVFFSFEKSSEPLPGFKRWIEENASWISQSQALKDFKGKHQEVAVYYGPSGSKIPRILYVGLGPAEKFELDKLRSAAAGALRKCRDLGLNRPALPLTALEGLPFESVDALREALIGGICGLYRYDALKTRDLEASTAPETLLLLDEKEPDENTRSAPSVAQAIASGVCSARDLVNAPANRVTPSHMADAARRLSEEYGFHIQVLNFDMAQTLGMGAFAAVAQGSREPAFVIILEHHPKGTEKEPPIVFVGKGITFDTGGISIKPSANMETMKEDMAGAAAVLGAFEVIGKLKIKRHVIGILPCTENMPDGKAYKPGDVIRSLSGLTIEVISTDAEGRMILCDALTYALRSEPALIVDLATLTGACLVALGKEVAGIMGNHEGLIQKIQEIGRQVGEKFWPLPLWDFYFEYIKSDVADFKNVGDRTAGTIIGGMFLKQFVPDEIPWAHLDIAGTAWADKDLGTAPKGATGFGVRLLVELAQRKDELNFV
jgi:leucyl aminopeptidase